MDTLALLPSGVDLYNPTPEQEKTVTDAANNLFTTMNQKIGKEGVVRLLLVLAFSESISDKNIVSGISLPDLEGQQYSNSDVKEFLINSYFTVLNSNQYKATFQKVANESTAWSNFCKMCNPTKQGGKYIQKGGIIPIAIGLASAIVGSIMSGASLNAGILAIAAGVGSGIIIHSGNELSNQFPKISEEQRLAGLRERQKVMLQKVKDGKQQRAEERIAKKAAKQERRAQKALSLGQPAASENVNPYTLPQAAPYVVPPNYTAGKRNKGHKKTVRNRRSYTHIV